MSGINHNLNAGQGALFTDISPDLSPLPEPNQPAVEGLVVKPLRSEGVEPIQKTWPESYGAPGSYVDVAERAKHLIAALEAYSARNSRKGFRKATFMMPHSKEIWGNYQENTMQVHTGANSNKKKFERFAAVSFWKATGYSALRGTRLMREGLIDPLAESEYDDFYFLYSHKSRVKDRREYRKALMRLIPEEEPAADEEQAA